MSDSKANTEFLRKMRNLIGPTGVQSGEVKTNYHEQQLTAAQASQFFFKHITSWNPTTVKADGLDPMKKTEVDLNYVGGVERNFMFPAAGMVAKFIFAFVADSIDDCKINASIKKLGWAPEVGQTRYGYVFQVPEGTEYASPQPVGARASEIMFPRMIPWKQMRSVWEITCPETSRYTYTQITDSATRVPLSMAIFDPPAAR
jgi:hypothetical protein